MANQIAEKLNIDFIINNLKLAINNNNGNPSSEKNVVADRVFERLPDQSLFIMRG